MELTYDTLRMARQRIQTAIPPSPCLPSAALSQLTGCEVVCKLDYLLPTGSFKERGALNALTQLSARHCRSGVIAASAGNHGLALAYHGRALGIPVTVVMPRIAPLTKVTRCRQLGARVALRGDHIEAARSHAMEYAETDDLVYINGYDHPDIIAGQGSIGLELLEQVPDLEAVLVPIGGGGLLAGVATAIKTAKPETLVVGVEPAVAASFSAALDADQPVRIDMGTTLADGLAVPCIGNNAFAWARHRVDWVIPVREQAIATAVLRLVECEKAVVEGAGAIGLAALLDGEAPALAGRKVVLLLCGGNIDTPVLGRIIDRGLAADGRLCRFEARISDQPGGLARFCALIAEAGASIRDIAHDRTFAATDLQSVDVNCIVETRDREHVQDLSACLQAAGIEVRIRAGVDP